MMKISRELKHALINKICARGGWATRIMTGLTDPNPGIRAHALQSLSWVIKSSEEAMRLLIEAEEID